MKNRRRGKRRGEKCQHYGNCRNGVSIDEFEIGLENFSSEPDPLMAA